MALTERQKILVQLGYLPPPKEEADPRDLLTGRQRLLGEMGMLDADAKAKEQFGERFDEFAEGMPESTPEEPVGSFGQAAADSFGLGLDRFSTDPIVAGIDILAGTTGGQALLGAREAGTGAPYLMAYNPGGLAEMGASAADKVVAQHTAAQDKIRQGIELYKKTNDSGWLGEGVLDFLESAGTGLASEIGTALGSLAGPAGAGLGRGIGAAIAGMGVFGPSYLEYRKTHSREEAALLALGKSGIELGSEALDVGGGKTILSTVGKFVAGQMGEETIAAEAGQLFDIATDSGQGPTTYDQSLEEIRRGAVAGAIGGVLMSPGARRASEEFNAREKEKEDATLVPDRDLPGARAVKSDPDTAAGFKAAKDLEALSSIDFGDQSAKVQQRAIEATLPPDKTEAEKQRDPRSQVESDIGLLAQKEEILSPEAIKQEAVRKLRSEAAVVFEDDIAETAKEVPANQGAVIAKADAERKLRNDIVEFAETKAPAVLKQTRRERVAAVRAAEEREAARAIAEPLSRANAADQTALRGTQDPRLGAVTFEDITPLPANESRVQRPAKATRKERVAAERAKAEAEKAKADAAKQATITSPEFSVSFADANKPQLPPPPAPAGPSGKPPKATKAPAPTQTGGNTRAAALEALKAARDKVAAKPTMPDSTVTLSKEIRGTTPESRKLKLAIYEGNGRLTDKEQNASDVLGNMERDPDMSDDLRELAARLRTTPSTKATTIKFVSETSDDAGDLSKSLGRHSGYAQVGVGSDITLRSSGWKEHGAHPVVVLHEVTHANTAKAIDRFERGEGTRRERAAVQRLREVLADLRKDKDNITKSLGGDQQAADNLLKNEKELVAYAFTDPNFRKYLQSKPSTWNKMVEAIRNLLGLDARHDNLLKEIMQVGNVIVEEQAQAESNYRVEQEQKLRAAQNNVNEEIVLSSDDEMTAPQTDEFSTWFGDSKVTGADGKPIVVYHGTSKDKDFRKFNIGPRGAWFTTNPDEASMYAQTNDSQSLRYEPSTRRYTEVNTASRVLPVFLSIQNPYVPSAQDRQRIFSAKGVNGYKRAQAEVFMKARALGHDGIQFGDGVWVAFSPEQIKSATANKGAYNKAKANIDEMTAPSKKEVNATFSNRQLSAETRQAPKDIRSGAQRKKDKLGQMVAKWLDSRRGDSPRIRMLKSMAQGGLTNAMYEVQASRNSLLALMDKHNLKVKDIPKDLKDLSKLPPAVRSILEEVRRTIDLNTVTLMEEFVKNNPNLTETELATITSMANNVGEYLHRSYQLFYPGEVGEIYLKTLLDPKNASGKEKIDGAKEYLMKNDLRWPENGFWKPNAKGDDVVPAVSRYHMERLYEAWTGRSASDKNYETMAEQLEEFAERAKIPENINKQADLLVNALMGLGDNKSPTLNFYRGSKLDRTIITPLTDVPPPIRKLWGEVEDPIVRLYSTWMSQENLVTQLQLLNRVYDAGIGEFLHAGTPPDPNKFSVQLTGQGFGPLQDMYTTPRVKDALDSVIGANKMAMEVMRPENVFAGKWLPIALNGYPMFGFNVGLLPAARWVKKASTAYNPAAWLYNGMGSALNLVMNGNFRAEGVGRGIAGVAGAIGLPYRKAVSKITSELVKSNQLDSSWVGEIKEADHRAILKALAADVGTADASSSWVIRAGESLNKADDVIVDAYAAADLWPKAANYFREKRVLKDFYERQGVKKTDDELAAEAGEITQRTNFSYARAIPLVKAVEGSGATMFATYFSEVFRTSIGNMVQGLSHMKLGKDTNDSGMILHGLSRVVGSLAGTAGHTALFGGAVWALNSLLNRGEDDEDKLAAIKRGMDDYDKHKILYPMGKAKDGTLIFFDLSRLDPIDPLNGVIRATEEEGLAGTGKALASMVFSNSLLGRIGESLIAGASDSEEQKKPTIARENPEVYADMYHSLTEAGASPALANGAMRLIEPLIPGLAKSLVYGGGGKNAENYTEAVTAMRQIGARPVLYHPVRNLQGFVASEYGGVLSSSKKTLAALVNQPIAPSEGRLKAEYLAGVAAEFKAFTTARQKIDAAYAAGHTRMEVAKALTELSGIPTDVRDALLRNKFTPHSFGETFLDSAAASLSKGKTLPEKREINRRVQQNKRQFAQWGNEYRKLIRER